MLVMSKNTGKAIKEILWEGPNYIITKSEKISADKVLRNVG